MDQSDNMLVRSLYGAGFALPQDLNTLSQISGDILLSICIQFIQFMGFQTKAILAIGTQQQFRIGTKVCEQMKKNFALRFELNSIINPNVNDLRKILVSLISKLSLNEEENEKKGKAGRFETLEEKIDRLREKRNKETLQKWTADDWIHPSISSTRFNKFRSYESNIYLQDLRSKLIVDGFHSKIQSGMFSSLIKTIVLKEKAKADAILLREQFYIANQDEFKNEKHLSTIEIVKSQNEGEWNLVQNDKKKINKLIQKMKEEVKQENQISHQIAEKQNLFNLEIQYQEDLPVVTGGSTSEPTKHEKNQTSDSLNTTSTSEPEAKQSMGSGGKIELDLNAIKQKNREQMNQLNQNLESILKKVEQYETKRTALEESINNKKEEIQSYFAGNKELQKQAQNLSNVLKQIDTKDGNQQVRKDIENLQKDIKETETEWEKAEGELEREIEELKRKAGDQKEKIEQMREKARHYENDYSQLATDTRNNYDKREALVEELKRVPKDQSRTVYVKRITEITNNFNLQRVELMKIVKEAQELQDSITFHQKTLDRHYTEIENAYNADSRKTESLNKQLFKIYQEYREIFGQIVGNLNQKNQRKAEAREIEGKMDALAVKGYQANIEKVKSDLQEITVDNENLARMLQGK